MSDRFSRVPIEQLLSWMTGEFNHDETLFGIHKNLFFNPSRTDALSLVRYGKRLQTPLGVAAGPHTQMAQNIICSWLTGSRYIELKTVQTLDQLDVKKPCIDMADEGYNCEWSQEFRLEESFDEYLNAFILLHVLDDMLGFGGQGSAGFLFNMSVGYNMEGILQPNVQRFLGKMAHCRDELLQKIEILKPLYPRIVELDIPDRISDNVTLSTMHGCPPDEIEKIARYLIEEKRLHTTVKLNPTLLGEEELRHILGKTHGYTTEVPSQAFAHDLKFDDAVALIKNLQKAADTSRVQFGLKLTNTLESMNRNTTLTPKEEMAYMSGRALHPISVHVACKLQTAFQGALDISFAGGVDCFNIVNTIACGLKPVTVCSDLLRPGGYGRMSQYIEALIAEPRTREYLSFTSRERYLAHLQWYAGDLLKDKTYSKTHLSNHSVKSKRELTPFDCISAPCRAACPSHQAIPGYMRHVAKGDYLAAYALILATNPLPHVTGMVCDHICQTKCTRVNYDDALLIREVKRFVAEKCHGGEPPALAPRQKNGKKVAIVGAGPSGLAAAYFLAMGGFAVDLLEAKNFVGGMVSDAIPRFRVTDEAIRKDLERIKAVGVNIELNQLVDARKFAALRASYDFVYMAIGAQRAGRLGIEGEALTGVWDQLTFLSRVIQGHAVELGQKVAIIGGGNSAMDAARTAKRLVGGEGEVTLVYRRTRREMPADQDEIVAAISEGIKVMELTAPVAIKARGDKGLTLSCVKMTLGAPDSSGRARPVALSGGGFDLEVDSVISAIGQEIAADFVDTKAATGGEFATAYPNVFLGGDAKRGASTVIRAIADGRFVAEEIFARTGGADPAANLLESWERPDSAAQQKRAATRVRSKGIKELGPHDRCGFDLVVQSLDEAEVQKEASRCLSCDLTCDVCVTVCPNRANISYQVDPRTYHSYKITRDEGQPFQLEHRPLVVRQASQVANIGDFCNECGNCATFCPSAGAPYIDKPKIYLTPKSFAAEDNCFYLDADSIHARKDGKTSRLVDEGDHYRYETEEVVVNLKKGDLALEREKIVFTGERSASLDTRDAGEMAILFEGLRHKGFWESIR